ncbi:MAG: hypothetical protein ABIO63_13365 [Casimicrobiaceae bacterium]
MKTSQIVRAAAATVSIVLVAAALIGATWYSNPHAAPSQQMVGVPTGEFVNGAAVHRLPSINVTASRSEVLAK